MDELLRSSENGWSKSQDPDFRKLFLGLFQLNPRIKQPMKGGMHHVIEKID
jgi:hypothetical protein